MENTHLRIFNLTQVTPNDVSNVLKSLGVNHTIMRKDITMRLHHVRPGAKKAQTADQPLQVLVTSSLDLVDRVRCERPTVVITTFPSSLFEVLRGNIESFDTPKEGLDNAVRWMLHEALSPSNTGFSTTQMTPSEMIEAVSPPSFLDNYHTIQCRITPYSLRTAAQRIAIGYLANKTSKTEAKRFFGTSLKFSPLAHIVLSESGSKIKKAVAAVQAGGDLEKVASEFDIDTFEISYIIQSQAKFAAQGAKKK